MARGFEANRDLVSDDGLAAYRYLHFATHATLDTERPELSALVLSAFRPSGAIRPAYLYAYEIYRLRLNAELVVLSACETGLGREVRGEGVVGLGRAFLFAGADSVLVSLWRVEDRATALLMERFYRGLLVEGQSPAAALRRAQASLWREGWAPYHWAGFVLQGRPR
jgi:CHAT domain-containing protein